MQRPTTKRRDTYTTGIPPYNPDSRRVRAAHLQNQTVPVPGFVDAYNPLVSWYDGEVIGVDVGITMVMAENTRGGFVWSTFMRNPEAQTALTGAGFTSY